MITVLRPPQTLQHAAIGLRFRDVSGDTSPITGLVVEIYLRMNPRTRKRAVANRSGLYVAYITSGPRDFGYDDANPVDERWADAWHACRVEVQDPYGRFLPLAFDADLMPADSPDAMQPWLPAPQVVSLAGNDQAPRQRLIEDLPLFPAPGRPLPCLLAVIHAQLRESGSLRVPAWSLLGVSIDGLACGIGLADKQGRVAVMFPYPEPPRQPLNSPPQERSDFRWTVDLSAFWSPASPSEAAPAMPDLAQVLAQLATPCRVIDSTASPAAPRRLDYRVPLTARTEGLPPADASFLLVSTT